MCSCSSASSRAEARRQASRGDPVPQALVITGLVVAFSATALAVALGLRLFEETGHATLHDDAPAAGTRGVPSPLMPQPAPVLDA